MIGLNTGFKNLFLHVISRNMAKSLFSVFIPLFLLANNIPLSLVGVYFLIQEICTITLTYFLFFKIHRWGIKSVAIMGILFQIIAIILLYFISAEYWIIVLIGLARGISHGLYWGVYDIFFVHISDGRFGKELGNFYLLSGIIGTLIIPFGGLILDNYHPLILMVSSACLEVISIYFISRIKITALRKNNPENSLFEMFKKREGKYIFTARNVTEILENTSSAILPIFIYVLYQSLFISGLFLMGASIFTGIYSYCIGKSNDCNKDKRFLIVLINILMSVLLILTVFFLRNPFSLILATVGLPFFRQ